MAISQVDDYDHHHGDEQYDHEVDGDFDDEWIDDDEHQGDDWYSPPHELADSRHNDNDDDQGDDHDDAGDDCFCYNEDRDDNN